VENRSAAKNEPARPALRPTDSCLAARLLSLRSLALGARRRTVRQLATLRASLLRGTWVAGRIRRGNGAPRLHRRSNPACHARPHPLGTAAAMTSTVCPRTPAAEPSRRQVRRSTLPVWKGAEGSAERGKRGNLRHWKGWKGRRESNAHAGAGAGAHAHDHFTLPILPPFQINQSTEVKTLKQETLSRSDSRALSARTTLPLPSIHPSAEASAANRVRRRQPLHMQRCARVRARVSGAGNCRFANIANVASIKAHAQARARAGARTTIMVLTLATFASLHIQEMKRCNYNVL